MPEASRFGWRLLLLVLAVLVGASVLSTGCSWPPNWPNPNPTPTPAPTPTPTPTPTPPPAKIPPTPQHCHVSGAVHSCYDNPPDGESFPEWDPNWGWVCEATDAAGAFIRRGTLEDCPDPPPPVEPPDECPEYLDGVPLERLTTQVNAFALIVNDAMAELTGCPVGSDCRLGDETRQDFQRRVFRALRDRGFCAGQHERSTDEIFVGPSIDSRLEGYHVFAGDGSNGPVPPGGTKRKVVWAPGANRPTWRVIGSGPPPPSGDCGAPIPPDPVRIKVRRHGGTDSFPRFDSTGLVGPDADYCAAVGYTDGRQNCPVRPDCNPATQECEFEDRVACELETFGDPEWLSDGEVVRTANRWQAKIRGGTWVQVCAGGICSARLNY